MCILTSIFKYLNLNVLFYFILFLLILYFFYTTSLCILIYFILLTINLHILQIILSEIKLIDLNNSIYIYIYIFF